MNLKYFNRKQKTALPQKTAKNIYILFFDKKTKIPMLINLDNIYAKMFVLTSYVQEKQFAENSC